MNWYLAKLVFQLRSVEDIHAPQFDEQWRLIRADDQEWAHEKAITLGRLTESNQFDNVNENGDWKFIGLKEITQIPCIGDGEKIFSVTSQLTGGNAHKVLIKPEQQADYNLINRE